MYESGMSIYLINRTTLNTRLSYQALLSVFRSRVFDTREREAAVEKCEVFIQDQPDKTECRLVVMMFCRHGMCMHHLGI